MAAPRYIAGTRKHWLNISSRDERGHHADRRIFGDKEVLYTLRCKNPAGCDQRVRVALKREEG